MHAQTSAGVERGVCTVGHGDSEEHTEQLKQFKLPGSMRSEVAWVCQRCVSQRFGMTCATCAYEMLMLNDMPRAMGTTPIFRRSHETYWYLSWPTILSRMSSSAMSLEHPGHLSGMTAMRSSRSTDAVQMYNYGLSNAETLLSRVHLALACMEVCCRRSSANGCNG